MDMRERINIAQTSPVDRTHPFLAPKALLEDPEGTPLARQWAMARADSFRRAH